MTSRNVYESALIEINKVEAPTMLLEDFNYLLNKVIYQYINKLYNIYDVNQLVADNLRVLKSTAVLKPTKRTDSISKLYGSFYESILPSDYFHILNCICGFTALTQNECDNPGNATYYAARRLTSDMWGTVLNNYYTKPAYNRPYYFIHNNNKLEDPFIENGKEYQISKPNIPTNPYELNTSGTGLGSGTDQNGMYSETNSNLSRTINNNGDLTSVVDRDIAVRYGNASDVRIEIRYGIDHSKYSLDEVHIDYLKVPQTIKLTENQLDSIEDTSQIMEFPDYVCYEIINELTKLLLENASDQRLQTHIPVNQSIASPAQTMQS